MKYYAGIVLLLIFWLTLSVAHIAGSMPPPRRIIDCNKVRPHTWVISSVDQKHYDVDVCGVADSAEGEDFRTVLEEKK